MGLLRQKEGVFGELCFKSELFWYILKSKTLNYERGENDMMHKE